MAGGKIPLETKVHKPTAFDAGIDNIVWRPGGKTKKRSDAPARYNDIDGFEEFIHHPTHYKDIQTDIYKIAK
jgi:hypothetical protein